MAIEVVLEFTVCHINLSLLLTDEYLVVFVYYFFLFAYFFGNRHVEDVGVSRRGNPTIEKYGMATVMIHTVQLSLEI